MTIIRSSNLRRFSITELSVKLIQAAALIILCGNTAFTFDNKAARDVIREEMLYPRDCMYFLPATISTKSITGDKLVEYTNVIKVAADLGVVKIETDKEILKIVPLENTSNLVQQATNLRYEVISLNFILGSWDVVVEDVRQEGNKTVVYGKKQIKKTTRLYTPIMSVLSDQEKNKYSTIPVIWEIVKAEGRIHVVEKTGTKQ